MLVSAFAQKFSWLSRQYKSTLVTYIQATISSTLDIHNTQSHTHTHMKYTFNFVQLLWSHYNVLWQTTLVKIEFTNYIILDFVAYYK